MKEFERYLNILIKSLLGGLFIGIGCLSFLSINNKVIGALFFTIGLFVIINFNLNLFTGKLCYALDNNNWDEIILILLGNFLGTLILSLICRLSSLNILFEKATTIWDAKLDDSLISLFFKAILCNILIYIAVDGFKNLEGFNKILALFFGVSIFIICGFEHSIADMFYMNFAGQYNGESLLRLIVIILGNLVGGIGINFLHTRCSNEIS